MPRGQKRSQLEILEEKIAKNLERIEKLTANLQEAKEEQTRLEAEYNNVKYSEIINIIENGNISIDDLKKIAKPNPDAEEDNEEEVEFEDLEEEENK